MSPHSKEEKEKKYVFIFNCGEALIINKTINIHRKMHVNIRTRSFDGDSLCWLQVGLLNGSSDFTLLV